jgi:hypothetical protein
MIALNRVSRCAVAALVAGSLSAGALAQSVDNPFGNGPSVNTPIGEAGEQRPQPRRGDNNPFGESGVTNSPFEFGPATPTVAPQSQSTRQPARQPAAAAPAQDGACLCLGESGPAAKAIQAALDKPLRPRGLEYDGDSLEEVVSEMSAEYGVPIQIDMRALADAGLGAEEPVTINLHGVTFKAALNHMLKQLNLTHVIRHEVLLITTSVEAEEHLKICLYDVRDLIDGPKDTGGLGALIDVIPATVAPETWGATGEGAGSIRPLLPGLLIVSQTSAVHEEVREMLAAIRQLNVRPVGAADVGRGGGSGREGGFGRGFFGPGRTDSN